MYKHALAVKCELLVCINKLCQFEHRDELELIESIVDNDEADEFEENTPGTRIIGAL